MRQLWMDGWALLAFRGESKSDCERGEGGLLTLLTLGGLFFLGGGWARVSARVELLTILSCTVVRSKEMGRFRGQDQWSLS